MNAYIIVEGERTEMEVYPRWLSILAPHLCRVDNPLDMTDNNYYLFTGGGIPSIYRHVANAAEDINAINAEGKIKIDYLIVNIDTEEESREYILEQINEILDKRGVTKLSFEMEVFEQKVSMETWFLGNRKVFKSNPQNPDLLEYIRHYNVRENDPELMGNIDEERFSNRAQFHHSYLRKMLQEQNAHYSKTRPEEVCQGHYLSRIIERYKDTGHIPTFGRWYEFVRDNF